MLNDDALLLVAHGSSRYADAGDTLLRHAAELRDHFAAVEVGFLNGTQSAADALARLPATRVHVMPFFMEDGYFTRVAVPRALAGSVRDLRYLPPVGTQPAMVEVIARRCQVAASASVLLIGHGSASSPGRRQALHAHGETLRARGLDVACAFLEEPPHPATMLRPWRDRSVAVLGFFATPGKHARDDVPAVIADETNRRGPGAPPLTDLGIIGDWPEIPGLMLDLVRASA